MRSIFKQIANLVGQQTLHNYLERKTESAVRGENAAKKRPSEADLDMEMKVRNKEIRILPFPRLIEKPNLPRKSGKRLPRIQELKRFCCAERDRARQLRIDELRCNKRGILLLCVSS